MSLSAVLKLWWRVAVTFTLFVHGLSHSAHRPNLLMVRSIPGVGDYAAPDGTGQHELLRIDCETGVGKALKMHGSFYLEKRLILSSCAAKPG